MTDLADDVVAAAVPPRYLSRYEKQMVGQPGASGGLMAAEGNPDVSQAAADTVALNALNGQRKHRYAGAGALPGSPPARYALGESPALASLTVDRD
jgi:hypothetical protein